MNNKIYFCFFFLFFLNIITDNQNDSHNLIVNEMYLQKFFFNYNEKLKNEKLKLEKNNESLIKTENQAESKKENFEKKKSEKGIGRIVFDKIKNFFSKEKNKKIKKIKENEDKKIKIIEQANAVIPLQILLQQQNEKVPVKSSKEEGLTKKDLSFISSIEKDFVKIKEAKDPGTESNESENKNILVESEKKTKLNKKKDEFKEEELELIALTESTEKFLSENPNISEEELQEKIENEFKEKGIIFNKEKSKALEKRIKRDIASGKYKWKSESYSSKFINNNNLLNRNNKSLTNQEDTKSILIKESKDPDKVNITKEEKKKIEEENSKRVEQKVIIKKRKKISKKEKDSNKKIKDLIKKFRNKKI